MAGPGYTGAQYEGLIGQGGRWAEPMLRRPGAEGARIAVWLARISVGSVFGLNISCALAFLFQPERYAPGFEVDGLPGRLMVQALGLLFIMWNVTYPPVVFRPDSQLVLFGVILVQQAIGLAGETWLWSALPPGHPVLWNTGLRFIIFDGLGLVLMGLSCLALLSRRPEP